MAPYSTSSEDTFNYAKWALGAIFGAVAAVSGIAATFYGLYLAMTAIGAS
jgi:hypothetical protein